MTNTRRVAYVIGFSAPPVLQLDEGIALLRERDWDSYVILSPTAATWVNVDYLAKASGHPVRITPRAPSEPDPLPDADAVFAAPITFNSLCKWATGISDTLALGILNESLGLPAPVTAAPCVKSTLRAHPAYMPNRDLLAESGVRILDCDRLISRDASGSVRLDWDLVLSSALA